MQKRLEILFSGRVQGVGFRFTTERISKRFAVTGFVRNLPNGKVQVAAEGEEEVLKEFLKAVSESEMSHFIRGAEASWSHSQGTFQKFSIMA